MSPIRIHVALAALLLSALGSLPAFGQDRDLRGMQLFEESDVRPYGNWAKPKEGFFFNFDGIFWHITAPKRATIGLDTTREVFLGPSPVYEETERSDLDTESFRAKWKQGDRIEAGFISGHHGLMVNTFELNRQTQYISSQNVSVVFNDPLFGPFERGLLQGVLAVDVNGNPTVIDNIPVTFTQLSARNRTKVDGVELFYMYRTHQLHRGGTLEWLLGARYLSFHDNFLVSAVGGSLSDSYWDTDAKNQIIGPEIGLRLAQPIGRFGLSVEGRFTGALNTQTVKQRGLLGSNLAPPDFTGRPFLMEPTGFENSRDFHEFTPLVEFRAEGHVQITRLISLRAGWAAIWMDNICRASRVIDYTVPSLGITEVNRRNRDNVLMQGLTLGIEVNH